MHFELKVTTSFGSCTSGGSDMRGLVEIGRFLSGMAEEEPNTSFTLQAQSGPDFDGFYGDIQSVRVEVTR